ncbi:MAG: hypothetical protein QFB87_00030 [Patescibacteria group bacterium]|nr:hypothetical protein [Patescibacteria group bacterium]
MNPTTNEVAGINLPPPIAPENMPGSMPGAAIGSLEMAPAAAETSLAPNPIMPPIALPIPSAPLPQVPISNVSSTTNSAAPAIADDADLIEKEWVQKAKEIINKTQNDPNQQSRELSYFKADYMQKRYNKVIKLSE